MKLLLTLLLFISTSVMADVKTMNCVGSQLIGDEKSLAESDKNIVMVIAEDYLIFDGMQFPYKDEMSLYMKEENMLKFTVLLNEGDEWLRSAVGKYYLDTNKVEFEDNNLKDNSFQAFVGSCKNLK